MKTLKDIIESNLPWIITTLLAAGAFGATVKYQGESIASIDRSVSMDRIRIENVEKNLIRFEQVQNDIKEIKDDIRDIKRIVLRPAITLNDSNISGVAKTK